MIRPVPYRRVGITPWRTLVTAFIFGALGGCIMPQQQQQGVSSNVFETMQATEAWGLGELELPPLPDDATTTREDEAGAPAVVLLDERTITHVVRPQGGAPHTVIEVRRAMRFDHRSAVRHAQVRIGLDAADTLLEVMAETRTPDGRVVPARKAQGFDLARYPETEPGRAVVFAFPYAEPGSIVRWAYRVREPGLRALDGYRAPGLLPVRRADYRLRSYDFVEIDHQPHGMAATEKEGANHRKSWRWQAEGLPFQPEDPGAAPRPSGRASVRLVVRSVLESPFVKDWSTALRPVLQHQTDLIPRLPASWPTTRPAEKPLTAAVDLVERDLAPGVTPLAPAKDDPTALHRFRRATPRVKAGLVYALLTRWEVDCRLWATNGPYATPISPTYPGPIDDLRLLVQCGRTIYDPGCEGCTVGRLSEDVRGRYAVSIGLDEDNRLDYAFRRVPARPVPPIERGYTLEITERGLVAATGEVVLHDVHADRVRGWLRDHPLPPKDAAEAAATQFLDDIEASRVEVSGHEAPDEPVRFALENVLLARGGFTRGAGWAIVSLDGLFGEPALRLATVQTRARPMVVAGDMGFVNTLRLPAAEGWAVVGRPAPTVIESAFGTYRLTHDDGEQTALAESLELEPGVIEPGDWPALRDFLARVAEHRRRPLTLRRTP